MVVVDLIFIWYFPHLCSVADRDSEAQVQHSLTLEVGWIHMGGMEFNHSVQYARCGILFKGYTPLY